MQQRPSSRKATGVGSQVVWALLRNVSQISPAITMNNIDKSDSSLGRAPYLDRFWHLEVCRNDLGGIDPCQEPPPGGSHGPVPIVNLIRSEEHLLGKIPGACSQRVECK